MEMHKCAKRMQDIWWADDAQSAEQRKIKPWPLCMQVLGERHLQGSPIFAENLENEVVQSGVAPAEVWGKSFGQGFEVTEAACAGHLVFSA